MILEIEMSEACWTESSIDGEGFGVLEYLLLRESKKTGAEAHDMFGHPRSEACSLGPDSTSNPRSMYQEIGGWTSKRTLADFLFQGGLPRDQGSPQLYRFEVPKRVEHCCVDGSQSAGLLLGGRKAHGGAAAAASPPATGR